MEENVESLLCNIKFPSDLKKLKEEQLPQLCEEIRQFIIDELSHNPGHFAASLGTVELTVALHYVFNTPDDKLVWDVGHQAYTHKILTGRKEAFSTNRKFHGLCGFPNPNESDYDAFIAGHASNSISAALGISVAQRLQKKSKNYSVAIIGDGAMTGGLAFEGLNNASYCNNNLMIVLNDNHMAIDNVVGGLSEYLVKLTTSQTYNKWRNKLYHFCVNLGLLKESQRGSLTRMNNSVKAVLTKQHNLFEGLNIRYFGPIDGHDVIQLVKIFRDVKDFNGPKVVHVKTVKGKGFKPAEKSATEWHAPGMFNKDTGEKIKPNSDEKKPPLFQDVFGHTLVELAKMNDKIVGVTPAMPSGCSMTFMMNEMPDRTFDVGIAEGHAVTFSAGLAKTGLMPFCNIYSSFMQRAYDNVIHDVALQNIDIVLCLDRAGLVGADGATHHGAFDLAYFRCVPNLTISSPMNEEDLRNLMFTAQNQGHGPFVIRYPRGNGVTVDWEKPLSALEIGKGKTIISGNDVAVVSIGPIGNVAKNAVEKLNAEGNSVALYNMIFLKPIDEELMHSIGKKFKCVVTIEDGVINGGLGSAVLEFFSDNNYSVSVKRIGIPDKFIEHGTPKELYSMLGMDEVGIYKTIKEFL